MKTSILATAVTTRAFYLQGQHVIAVAGLRPAGGEITLEEIVTAEGTIVLHLQPPARNPDAMDAYYIVRPVFHRGSMRRSVRILHADGPNNVPVEPLCCAARHVTGSSPSFCFDEAFADALRQLPPFTRTGKGQELPLVDVLAVGAIYGGFSGFSRLFLRVGAGSNPRGV